MKGKDAAGVIGLVFLLGFGILFVVVRGMPILYEVTRYMSKRLNKIIGLYIPDDFTLPSPAAVLGAIGWVGVALAFGVVLLIFGAPVKVLAILVIAGASGGAVLGTLSVQQEEPATRQTLQDIFPE